MAEQRRTIEPTETLEAKNEIRGRKDRLDEDSIVFDRGHALMDKGVAER